MLYDTVYDSRDVVSRDHVHRGFLSECSHDAVRSVWQRHTVGCFILNDFLLMCPGKLTGSSRYIKNVVSFPVVSLLSRAINRFAVIPGESSFRNKTFKALVSLENSGLHEALHNQLETSSTTMV